MKHFLKLSKENVKLAKEEVDSLIDGKSRLIGNYLFIDEKIDFFRLAYSSKVYFNVYLKGVNWNNIIKGSFKVEGKNAKKYASSIWGKLDHPKVDVRNPDHVVEFIKVGDKTICGLLVGEIKGDFESRKAHKKPGFYPMSLHPKLARAMINISKGKKVLDPFCGAGTILVEGGLIGLDVVGSDISEKMVELSKINLKHYKIKKYKLYNKDVLSLDLKVDAIVTDPPYGRSSYKTLETKELLDKFLVRSLSLIKPGGRIVFTFDKNLKKIPKEYKLINKFKIYVHKSLNRYLYVLEKWK